MGQLVYFICIFYMLVVMVVALMFMQVTMLVVVAQSQLMVILVGVHAFSILVAIFITTVQSVTFIF